MSFLTNVFIIGIISLIYLSSFYIKCSFILPFDTIFIKDKTIEKYDYYTNLTQNELYINFSIGSNKEEIKLVLKMDKYGFLIYENAYDYNNSKTFEKYVPDIDENIKTTWVPSSEQLPSKDNLYLSTFDLENNKYNIIKTNKTLFLRIKQKENESNYFNEMYYKYGIIGLKLNTNSAFNAPEFITSLKASDDIDSYTFILYFNTFYKNGFATNNNKGYIYIGESNNKDDNDYIDCPTIGGELIWGFEFEHIYLKDNENNIIEIEGYHKRAKIIGTYPYIIGNSEYFKYINKNFFNDLLEKEICFQINFTKHDIYFNYDYYSYACNSESKFFMDYLNNNFPDLILENKKNVQENFTFTKKDLFAFNTNNDSDTNLYFLILSSGKPYEDWMLGIPFLKKYVFSYDYDKNKFIYLKNFGEEKKGNNEGNNFFSSITFKILLIILLIIIFFILGILFQKYIKKSRKKKANELDDDYEYESHHDKDDNNYNKNNKEKESLGINE